MFIWGWKGEKTTKSTKRMKKVGYWGAVRYRIGKILLLLSSKISKSQRNYKPEAVKLEKSVYSD